MILLEDKIYSFAIDFSDLSLKFLDVDFKRGIFSKRTKPVLKALLNKEIEPGIIERGEIKKKNVLSEIIRETISFLRIKKKFVAFSLPEEESFLRVIKLPFIEGKENVKRAAFLEAENYIPLSLDEVYIDADVIDYSPDRKNIFVFIAAIPKNVADPYVEVVKKAGLIPRGAEVESLSIVRSLLDYRKKYPPLLIVDFGATRTSFIIYSQNSVKFTTTSLVSASSLTDLIARSFRVSQKKAENLKKKYGLLPIKKIRLREETGDKVFEKKIIKEKGLITILEPTLRQLVAEIEKYREYYLSHVSKYEGEDLKKMGIQEIILCGGGSNLKGLETYLSQKVGLKVKKGNPWINFPIWEKDPPVSKEDSLSFTTAIGLIKRNFLDK